MTNKSKDYQISDYKLEGIVRYLFRDSDTFVPSIAMSLYETHLLYKTPSHNTRLKELREIIYLFRWAKENELDLDTMLLQGKNLSPTRIRSFSHWLDNQRSQKGIRLTIKTRNSILTQCAVVISYFMQQYGEFGSNFTETGEQSVMRRQAIGAVKSSWYVNKKKNKVKPIAEDLSEAEIEKINTFLKPKSEYLIDSDPLVIRNYLIWRLAIEFGLRSGEILALRLEDLPSPGGGFLRIVRIEERDDVFFDPRKNPPRPKTLSRELGFVIENSPIHRLISEYVSRCRVREVYRFGEKRIEHVMNDHPFLICSTKTGEPLTIPAINKLSEKIRLGSGVRKFHWHIARHAFFNRAYAAIHKYKADSFEKAKKGLIYYGGWESEKSLYLYVNRVLRDESRITMKIHTDGKNKWKALR